LEVPVLTEFLDLKTAFQFFNCCKKNGVAPARFVLVISVTNQTVSLFEK
jgi:hypothetical protein